MRIIDRSPSKWAALIAAVGVLMVTSWASAVTVDPFTDGYFNITITGSAGTGSSTDTGSMIGGERETTLVWSTPPSSGGDSAVAKVEDVASGKLKWNEDDGIEGTLTLLYDGVGSTGLGGVDFTDAGVSDAFLFGFSNDHPLRVTIDVWTGSEFASVTADFPLGNYMDGVLFSQFTAINPLVDFTSVDKLRYTFDSSPAPNGGGDYVIMLLETGVIPEPLTMLGVFGGVAAVGGYVRKRRKA